MKLLEYIGLKQDGERAFQAKTGIEWMPGAQHHVQPEHALEMLKHTDVWREVAAVATAVAHVVPGGTVAGLAAAAATAITTAANVADTVGAVAGAVTGDGTQEPEALPDWAKKGIDLGATDDQLEAIAQAGGPETEAGAALWRDAVGTDWKAAEIVVPAKKATPAKKAANNKGNKSRKAK